MGRLQTLCAHLVGHHVFDKARACSARAVDFDRGVELLDGVCALAGFSVNRALRRGAQVNVSG
jgi:hypothetical protein